MSLLMTIKKKLLILNGSHSDIPLIKAGKELGFHVITTGNAPELIGHSYADEYYSADYSNKNETLDLAKKLSIDAICSCANDFGAITAAYVAEKMGLAGHDSYDIALLLHHKDSFKRFSQKYNIPTPCADCFDTIESALDEIDKYSFPLIIKPVDLTGGKGVSTVWSQDEYVKGIESAFELSVEKRIVVEEFFIGTQHSFSSFLLNRKVVFSFSDNEYSYLNPFYVSSSAAPAIDVEKYSSTLVNAVEKIAGMLNLTDGIFHIQYLANGQEATIIDITRRCSGDLYPYPVNHSTNINWSDWIVRAEAGLDCSKFPEVKQTGFCGRHCVMSNKNGIIADVTISEEVRKYIYDSLFWWKSGDIIDNYLSQKVGVVFLQFDSMDEMLDITKCLSELIQVKII
ncbi:MAG: hypothetical protein KZQ83_11970 [gamma proteobacterium symbiont of Taylorina sp.]|nr:hypothetical protein [gamma proteobacterium symbiont of Taylorina sp.]